MTVTADPSPVPDVSVIIVNWNTCGLLRNCLRSIKDETRSVHEIIVVDNASTDGSADMIRREFPDVRLIANGGNRGFAAANNQGLVIAKGRHVLLLNPDTVILDGAIDIMLARIGERPDVGCLGCQVRESAEVIQRTCFSDPSPLNQFITEFGLMRLSRFLPVLGRPWYRDWSRETARYVDVVSGMFMLVPKSVVDRVGPLDEAFFVYAEEADWCRRIRKAGWHCAFDPAAKIIHLDGGSKSTAQIRSRMYIQMQKSHVLYARKHHGRIGKIMVHAIYVSSALLRFGIFGLRHIVRASDETRARMRLAGASLRFHLTGQEPES